MRYEGSLNTWPRHNSRVPLEYHCDGMCWGAKVTEGGAVSFLPSIFLFHTLICIAVAHSMCCVHQLINTLACCGAPVSLILFPEVTCQPSEFLTRAACWEWLLSKGLIHWCSGMRWALQGIVLSRNGRMKNMFCLDYRHSHSLAGPSADWRNL